MANSTFNDTAALCNYPFSSILAEFERRMKFLFDGHRVYLSPREAADFLGVSERMIFALTVPRGPIPVVHVGRLVRYDKVDLIAFMDAAKQRQVANTPPAQAS